MACSNCKKKKDIYDQMNKTGQFTNNTTIWVLVIWSLLGLYGVYSLISKFL